MDGGIGEAALMGAVIGGGSSAITGGDPLKGALMGGLTSGVMGGFGGLEGVQGLSSATPEVASVAPEVANVAPEFVNAGGYAQNIPLGGTAQAASNAASTTPFSLSKGIDIVKANPWTFGGIAASQALPGLMQPKTLGNVPGTEKYNGPLSKFHYDPNNYTPDVVAPPSPVYTAHYAQGGIAALADGGSLQQAPANINFMGNDMYPQSQIEHSYYATPSQMPTSAQQTLASYEPKTNPLTGTPTANMAAGGIAALAQGGSPSLGGYSDGGQMLKGPGDGMSDSIPAHIGGKQPARLADGEFVVPADVVSHLGNGSTDAGAKQLYSMMNKVRKARTGNPKQGKQIKPEKYLP